MAAAELKPEVTCSICTDIFTDPITLICGHSFCQVCITRTFDSQQDGEYFCPECMKKFGRCPELKKNQRLSNIADHFHSVELKGDQPEKVCSSCVDLPVPAVTLCLFCEAFLCDVHQQEHSKSPEHVLINPITSLEDRTCPVHKKILEYCCIDDGTCICAHCMTSDHNGHKVYTITEFLQQQIKNLNPILEKLSSKREESETMLQSLQDHKMKIDKEADGVAGKVNAIMKGIRIKQEDLENRVLAEVSRQRKQISLSVSNDIQQLEYEKSEIEKKITQIEELSRNTNPISSLQTAEVLLCVPEEENNLDTGMGRQMIHKAGDLEKDVILETLHSGLSNIVVGAGKVLADVNMPLILGQGSTTQEMLPGVNIASTRLLIYDYMDNDYDNDIDNDYDDDIDNDYDDDIDNDYDDDIDNDYDDDIDNDYDDDIDNDYDDDNDNDYDNDCDRDFDYDNDDDNDNDYDNDNNDYDNDYDNYFGNDIDNNIDNNLDNNMVNDIHNDIDITWKITLMTTLIITLIMTFMMTFMMK